MHKRVGQANRVVKGWVSPAADAVTFQWLRKAKPIKHATHPKYRLRSKDLGKRIFAVVTYHRAGFQDLSVKLKVVKRVRR